MVLNLCTYTDQFLCAFICQIVNVLPCFVSNIIQCIYKSHINIMIHQCLLFKWYDARNDSVLQIRQEITNFCSQSISEISPHLIKKLYKKIGYFRGDLVIQKPLCTLPTSIPCTTYCPSNLLIEKNNNMTLKQNSTTKSEDKNWIFISIKCKAQEG